ncbi:MAG: PAS domain S-box protein [Blastocatellia bacterium]|nr:PAS domain S-box protein [Blastocatellia bacterium]
MCFSCKHFYALLMLVLVGLGTTQAVLALDPKYSLTQYLQRSWNREKGIPSSSILSLLQTRNGYIWIGTYNGLVRFDGVRVTVFSQTTTPEFKSNGVLALEEDAQGGVWAGTNGGGLVRYFNGAWQSFTTNEGLTGNIVQVLKTEGTRLWVGTSKGVNLCHVNQTIRFETVYAQADNPDLFALAFAHSPTGSLLVGTPTGVFEILSEAGWRMVPFFPTETPAACLLRDRANTLWVGTFGGLYHLTSQGPIQYRNKDGLTSDRIGALCEDREGNLWIGTDGGGVNRMVQGTITVLTEKQGFPNNAIKTILEDREGTLWVGTYRGGLVQLQNPKCLLFSTKEGLNSKVAWQVFAEPGRIWITTENGINQVVDGAVQFSYQVNPKPTLNIIHCMVRDQQGVLWIGTNENGLYRFDERKNRFLPFDRFPVLNTAKIRTLAADRSGNLWIGAATGLFRFDGAKLHSYQTSEGLSSNSIMSIFEDSTGCLWVGTKGGGINCLSKGGWSSFRMQDGLPSEIVFSVFEDHDHQIWALTNAGLALFQGKQFQAVIVPPGLGPNSLFYMVEDRQGFFWFGTDTGLRRVSRRDLLQSIAGRTSQVYCRTFGIFDGLRSEECAATGQPAQTPDGKLWFPTLDGVAVFDPATVTSDRILPPVLIEAVKHRNQNLSPLACQHLSATQNTLDIQYTALSFVAPEAVHLQHRLIGFDPDWLESNPLRTAYYTNLPPGSYTFRVRAANSEDIWNPEEASLQLVIHPPWWRTAWASGAFAVAGISLLALTLQAQSRHARQRVARQLEKQELRLAQSEAEALRVRAEALVQEGEIRKANQRKLRELTASVPGVIFQYCHKPDQSGRFLFVSDGIQPMFGVEAEDVLWNSDNFWGLFTQPESQELRASLHRAARQKSVWEATFSLPNLNETGRRWFQVLASPFPEETGALLFNGIIIDISEERGLAENLADKEQFLSMVLENSPDQIFLVSLQGVVEFVNSTILPSLPKEDVLDRPLASFIFPEDRERFQQIWIAVTEGSPDCEFEGRLVHSDGSIHWYQVRFSYVKRTRKKHHILSLFRDITKRKKLDERLHMLEAAIECTMDALVITEAEPGAAPYQKIVFVNPAFLQMTGYREEEVLGRNVGLLHGPHTSRETVEEIQQAMANRNPIRAEIINYRKDGTEIWVDLTINPIWNPQGQVAFWVGLQRDITEQKKVREGEQLAARMRSLGVLSSGIAHDFNNILQPLQLSLDLLRLQLPEHSPLQKRLDAMKTGIQRGVDLVTRIRAFSRGETSTFQQVDMKGLIEEVRLTYQDRIAQTVTLNTQVSDCLWPVWGDRTQLFQLILNGLVNACDALPASGGTVSMTCRNAGLQAAWTGNQVVVPPGSYCRVDIADTGKGIPAHLHQRIFEPFFTTKEKGKGTGLGLAIMYSVVQGHNGYMDVVSVESQGTTFTFFLPVQPGLVKTKLRDQ